MKKLTLTNHAQSETTVLENEFIDRYMPEANGEYVKVYLLLLRHLNAPTGTLTVSRIADLLDHTEKDVVRALNYWKNQGLLKYETVPGEASSSPAEAAKSAASAPAKDVKPAASAPPRAARPAASAPDMPDIQQYRSRKEFKELMFVAEQYLGKTLSVTDVSAISYFYDTLGMSADLIEYLIEYCVENGHKSIHYIKKVALSWHERGITTAEEAKAGTLTYNRNCYSVLNAFGIKGRAPVAAELSYINKWTGEYGFSLDIIIEACSRTISAIHQPSFDYADSILRGWLEKDVRHLADIKVLDEGFLKEKERRKRQGAKSAKPKNKFNNFEGRSYDMDELEKKLIQQ